MKYLPHLICGIPTVNKHCTSFGFHYVSQNLGVLEMPATEGFGFVFNVFDEVLDLHNKGYLIHLHYQTINLGIVD
jgi:hypothetical protein